jgi:hypothetical protein
MERFFCIRCNLTKDVSLATTRFTSGYVREGHVDIPMGICKDHIETAKRLVIPT